MDEDRKEFLLQFGKRVKFYRLQCGMTLEELANKMGYTSDNARSSAQKIEAGKNDLPASKITMLAQVLNVSISDLMGWGKLESKDTTDCIALTNYLKSLGYSIEVEGTGKAIKDHDGNVIDAEHWKHTLTKDGTTAIFIDDEWDAFVDEIQKTVDYQIWRKAGG